MASSQEGSPCYARCQSACENCSTASENCSSAAVKMRSSPMEVVSEEAGGVCPRRGPEESSVVEGKCATRTAPTGGAATTVATAVAACSAAESVASAGSSHGLRRGVVGGQAAGCAGTSGLNRSSLQDESIRLQEQNSLACTWIPLLKGSRRDEPWKGERGREVQQVPRAVLWERARQGDENTVRVDGADSTSADEVG